MRPTPAANVSDGDLVYRSQDRHKTRPRDRYLFHIAVTAGHSCVRIHTSLFELTAWSTKRRKLSVDAIYYSHVSKLVSGGPLHPPEICNSADSKSHFRSIIEHYLCEFVTLINFILTLTQTMRPSSATQLYIYWSPTLPLMLPIMSSSTCDAYTGPLIFFPILLGSWPARPTRQRRQRHTWTIMCWDEKYLEWEHWRTVRTQ